MYSYRDIKTVHLEITSKCQARCPMCPRRLQGGPLLSTVKLHEITLEQFQNWFPQDFIKQLEMLYMCGNLGDPVVAKDTLEIFKYIRSLNSTIHLKMHTNGSARNKDWWKQMAEINVEIVFGIDGLEDTHSRYRIGTDWNQIIENAKHFISHGGFARWDMLVFQHNEHQVETCRQLSKEFGFADFIIKHTSRFKDNKLEVLDDNYSVIDVLYPTEKSTAMISKASSAQKEVLPKISCKAKKDSSIYVSANGNVSPCCWIDFEWIPEYSPFRIDYMIKIKEIPNLTVTTLDKIFSSGYFNKIENCWTGTGLKECSKQCGSFDKLQEQYIKNE